MTKKIFIILNFVLITAAVFFGVRLFYGIVTANLDASIVSAHLQDKSPVSRSVGKSSGTGKDSRRSFSSYQSIIKRDLFKTGRADKSKEEKIDPSELENLQKTKLSLKLWGTITGNTGTTYAVIENTSKREQQLYREGNEIEHARIKLILRKKIVLTVDGRDEILEMEEVDQEHRVSSVPGIDEDRSAIGQEEMVIDRETINHSLENINDLMRQVRIRPHFKDGKPDGLQLSGVRQGSVFEEIGLQSGDVVKGVNGRKLESVDDALGFYQNLQSAQDVELEIERSGQTMNLNYRID